MIIPSIKSADLHKNCAGKASRAVATSILKFHADSDKNVVFSPFGFSSILSFLSEGAEGETLSELQSFLRHDIEIDSVRKHYYESLQELQGNDPLKAPQFKTWFYYYMNNTIDDGFARIMKDKYFVEVKEIARTYYDWNEPETSIDLNDDKEIDNVEVKVAERNNVVGVEDKDEIIEQNLEDTPARTGDTSIGAKPTTPPPDSNNSKDIIGFDELKSEPFDNSRSDEQPFDKSDEPIPKKECSKFDQVVDDHQYVEVPVIKKEIEDKKIEDNETVKSDEKLDKFADENGDEPTKIRLPLKKLEDNFEIMQAVESHPIKKRVSISTKLFP